MPAGDDLPTDPWLATGRRLAESDRLHVAGLIAEVPCFACGLPALPARSARHVCVVCHWQDDGCTRDQPDRPSPANRGLTLREAAEHVAESGVAVSRWDSLVRPEFFAPSAVAARADLAATYERLLAAPHDPEVRAEVRTGRAAVMRALVNLMR
jgi:hypothetical protein